MSEIVRTQQARRNDLDFIAIGNLLVGVESTHSAFIIQYRSEISEFHYTGKAIEFNQNSRDYHHCEISVIHKDEVPAFIALCLNVQKNANPKYGYFYSGESYDLNGRHLSDSNLGEVMTCAGFCLNVLKGFLEDDYLSYADWENTPYPYPEYVTRFCNVHGLDIDKIQSAHRRITPRECLISCRFSQLPIRKSQIDGLQLEFDQYFSSVANRI